MLQAAPNSPGGGKIDSTALKVGDDGQNRQYRAILSFKKPAATAPTGYELGILQLTPREQTGLNPFLHNGLLLVETRPGNFGAQSGLESADFQSPAYETVGIVLPIPIGSRYYALLNPFARLRWSAEIQIRLAFTHPSNGNQAADTLSFHSGQASDPALRPQLTIYHILP